MKMHSPGQSRAAFTLRAARVVPDEVPVAHVGDAILE